jgi:hypothetical protein
VKDLRTLGGRASGSSTSAAGFVAMSLRRSVEARLVQVHPGVVDRARRQALVVRLLEDDLDGLGLGPVDAELADLRADVAVQQVADRDQRVPGLLPGSPAVLADRRLGALRRDPSRRGPR